MKVLVTKENWKDIQIKLFSFGCKWLRSGLELQERLPDKVKYIKIDENNLMTTSPFLKY